MQVSVESIGKLERRMQVQVPAERVSKEIAARLQTISRTARLNGFRPGKAPLKVIRQQFNSRGRDPRADPRLGGYNALAADRLRRRRHAGETPTQRAGGKSRPHPAA